MLPTDQTSRTPVSGSVDRETSHPSRTTGRRRAVAAAPVVPVAAPLSFDAAVSPRRAARAAREAAAAAAMTAAVAGPASAAPVSPVLPPTAAVPVVVAGSSPSPVVTAPARATSDARRQTFVPAPAGHAVVRSQSRGAVVRRRPVATVPAPVATTRPRRPAFGRLAGRIVVAGVVAGIVATTCILPAIGHTGASKAFASTNADGSTTVHIGDQTYDVAAGVDNQVLARDGYSATSVVDYEKQVIANRKAETSTTYTGPTAAEYLLHPLYSHDPLDRAQVFDVALQYLGTPYVHGGADPSAFDCSGFIMFVYAQFGISLPHYVPSQDAIGTTIPQSEAVPGDLVIFDNDEHDGFYAGNGMIMDAPKPGGFITVRPIWDQPHHFVRINP